MTVLNMLLLCFRERMCVPGRVRPPIVYSLQDAVLCELQQVVVEHFPEL